MTLLNPAGLLFGVVLLGLVLLYLWERNQRRFDVPSMLLWEVVPDSVVRRNRFQPDSLFWLQLAGLACLVLGLANPFIEGSAREIVPGRTILVVDLSASMQTIEGEVSRLELAREAASRVALSAAPDSELMLIGASREPKILAPFTRDRGRILEVATALEASDVAANLEPVLAMAQRMAFQSSTPTEVHVFTDLPRESVAERWRQDVNWWPFGTTDDNLAIAGVETTKGILQSKNAIDARVTVRNFGAGRKQASLTVSVDGEAVARELFTAAPFATTNFHFPALTASGLLEASLESEDSLAVDNSWRSWLPAFKPTRIALIGATPELRSAIARIEAATQAIDLVALDAATPSPDPSVADVAIYYRVSPQTLPAIPALLIAPPSDATARRVLAEAQEVEVLDWNDRHETLRGIEPNLIRPFDRVVVTEPPDWSETVLSARTPNQELPLLMVGRPERHRVAIFAPDIEGERLLASDRETTLLLFLNLIDWLADDRADVSLLRSGESRPLDAAGVVEVLDPHGELVPMPAGPKPFLTFERVGTYRLRHRNGSESIALVNFQDAAESDIGRNSQPPYRAELGNSGKASRSTDGGLRNWLYAAAALLLLSEWFAASRALANG